MPRRAAMTIGTIPAITVAMVLVSCGSSSRAQAPTTAAPGTPPPTTTAASTSPSTTPAPTEASHPSPDTKAPAIDANPPGDIPDNQVFVVYAPTTGTFSVKVPEGWAEIDGPTAVTFTDKYNSVRIEATPSAVAPDVASATASEVPQLASSDSHFQIGKVSNVKRPAGDGVLVTYSTLSPTNPVTGKAANLAVERYEFWRDGIEVVLTLSGPTGADNVDPWRTVTDSLRWA